MKTEYFIKDGGPLKLVGDFDRTQAINGGAIPITEEVYNGLCRKAAENVGAAKKAQQAARYERLVRNGWNEADARAEVYGA